MKSLIFKRTGHDPTPLKWFHFGADYIGPINVKQKSEKSGQNGRKSEQNLVGVKSDSTEMSLNYI